MLDKEHPHNQNTEEHIQTNRLTFLTLQKRVFYLNQTIKFDKHTHMQIQNTFTSTLHLKAIKKIKYP